MGEIKSYRDLKVWQKGIDIVKEVYSLCAELPNEEKFGLQNQLKRAAVSIPSNIAEGYGRNTSKNYAQFLRISRGSIYEVETLLVIVQELNRVAKERCQKLVDSLTEEAKMMNSFIKAVTSN